MQSPTVEGTKFKAVRVQGFRAVSALRHSEEVVKKRWKALSRQALRQAFSRARGFFFITPLQGYSSAASSRSTAVVFSKLDYGTPFSPLFMRIQFLDDGFSRQSSSTSTLDGRSSSRSRANRSDQTAACVTSDNALATLVLTHTFDMSIGKAFTGDFDGRGLLFSQTPAFNEQYYRSPVQGSLRPSNVLDAHYAQSTVHLRGDVSSVDVAGRSRFILPYALPTLSLDDGRFLGTARWDLYSLMIGGSSPLCPSLSSSSNRIRSSTTSSSADAPDIKKDFEQLTMAAAPRPANDLQCLSLQTATDYLTE
ncbi:hypothetical protein K437DRAFT_270641 [Tilletiaria anomala UBC 951]|uniref:Uncharacterized protein n=1 Tax=Tilletiaria anomala (strain ATCC 24038 / CBS 436.72 / UBC 951) TaxID=1037660 RepID=A0A066VHZ0_TILAU|nr:uncharacterized protein K437DRAFT_270641 [Tilletiaria anomala UBC 951]KDN38210.1 hypothetical protein K437DRAFT_270641 [Tilletiaria anomala UBC 951]